MKNLSLFLHFAVLVLFIGITVPCSAVVKNYYYKGTGNLNTLSSWAPTTGGTGAAPTNFTAANQVFNIINSSTATISANWTVSGGGSYIVVGDGTNACNFKIPTTSYCKGTINVSANGTLTIANTTIPTLSTLDANSTVIFDGTANQAIPAVTYGTLTYSGSATATMAGACTIGTLNVTSSGILELDNGTSAYTFTIGSINMTGSKYIDLATGSSNAIINLSGNLYQTSGQLTVTSSNAPNGAINFTGTSSNIQVKSSLWVNYTVLNGSTCTLTGNVDVDGSNPPTYDGILTVNSGGTLDCGLYAVTGPNDASNSFVLSSGANLITANTAGIASSGSTGSITTAISSFSSGANYTYDGSAAQITGIFTTTPTASTVNNLTINNSSTTGVTLSQAENVAGALTLTDGLLNTTALTLITVNNNGSTTGASNNSFVNGPIAKVGQQAFVFPVGDASTGYIPIAISAPSSMSDVFLAQYNLASGAALGSISIATLNHVSSCDYWTLNHTNGSSTVNVTAYWNTSSPCTGTYVTNLATVVLAHFNTTGLTWDSYGNTSVSGTTASGSITWNGVSTFSPFALGSTSLFNPLPLTLVDFNAAWQSGGTVGLTWEIQDGVDVNHFDIQRSADGVSFQTIGTLDASGSSSVATDYSYADAAPLPTADYYRLQLVNDAGNDTYSAIKVVSRSSASSITISPNPAKDHINVSFGTTGVSGPVSIRLMNMTGQLLLQKSVAQPMGETITLPVGAYPAGSYLVQVIGNGQIKQASTVLIIR